VSGSGEAATYTITSNATSANTASTIVARDASNNFSAGTITSALTGNATTATTLQTARTINGVSFDGSTNITVAAAAGTLTGTTLASGVTASSLTSVGTLSSLSVTGDLTVDTSTLKVDSANNRVGIGTASPGELLHVQAADTVTGTLIVKGGKVTVTDVGEINSQLDFGSNDTSVNNTNNIGGRIASVTEISNGSFTGLAFYTFEQGRATPLQEAVRISYSGAVGIGVTIPETLLHINKATSGGEGGYIYIDNPASSASGNKAGIKFGTSAGASFASVPTGEITNVITNAGDGASALTFGTFNGSASGERMRIDASGNVGIGVTPSARLHIVSTGQPTILVADDSGRALAMKSPDSVGTPAFVGTTTNHNLSLHAGFSGAGENFMSFATGGTERMRIGASGNVGIGTTNPGGKLQVAGGDFIKSTGTGFDGTFDNVFKYMATGDVGVNNNRFIGANATITAGAASANKLDFRVYQGSAAQDAAPLIVMTLLGDGNVGIGTTTPAVKLDILGDNNQIYLRTNGSFASIYPFHSSVNTGAIFWESTGTMWIEGRTATGKLIFGTGGTQLERARITAAGVLSIGSTADGADGTNTGIWLRGNISVIQASRTSEPSGNFYRLSSNGDVLTFNRDSTTVGSISVTTTATAYNTSSDRRLKKNILPAPVAWERLKAIQIVSYDWRAGGHTQYGVIAQDELERLPEAIKVGDDGEEVTEQWGVDLSKAVPVAIKALQEAMARIESLETSNAELMARIDTLES
jgi:hypothetical protein